MRIRAKMKDHLIPRYIGLAPDLVDMPDEETQRFLASIEGKEVELVFTRGDAFEKEDNNIWLPDCLWTALEPYTPQVQDRFKNVIPLRKTRK